MQPQKTLYNKSVNNMDIIFSDHKAMKGKINKKDFFNAKNTQNAEAGES
jgi:hypothetical protein